MEVAGDMIQANSFRGLSCMVFDLPLVVSLTLVAGLSIAFAQNAESPPTASDNLTVAQSNPTPAPIAPSAASTAQPGTPTPPDAAQEPEPIGNVATLQGTASVTRNKATTPLKISDDIFKNDTLQTTANSTLGVTFNDATTFNLTGNARIVINNYVYDETSTKNAALFNVARGTVAFVASAVAKTGDMKISTPTATLGIRGTTGLIEVPDGPATTAPNTGNPANVNIKLYPDQDGKVGRIEVNGRDGARLGLLSQGATGFAIRPGAAGARFAAIPLQISPQQIARDQGIVRQVHAAQAVGRQIVTRQRAIRQQTQRRQQNQQRRQNLQQQRGLQKQPQRGLGKPRNNAPKERGRGRL
jgi:hypothetical protein